MPTLLPRPFGPSVLLAAATTFASFSAGQTPAAPTLGPDRVTFFTEPNFKGDALTVEAGASVDNLARMTRPTQAPWALAISSVRVEGAARATAFTGAGFSGDRLDISRSIPDLYTETRASDGGSWDRAIVSVTVTGPARVMTVPPGTVAPGNYPTQMPPTAQTPYPSQAPGQPPTVVVVPPSTVQPYPVQPGPNQPPAVVVVPAQPPPTVVIREPRVRMDRRTADLIVQHAYREVLNRAPDPEGARTYRDRLMYEGWSERQIVEQLQRSGEARAVNAVEAITRIYREVLGRDPDPSGLAHYRAKWREGWTQGQIRDDLRRSGEGRDGAIRAAIVRAYRELLGREPDPAGYATYERLARERGYTERDIRNAIMAGDEYRQKHPRGR